MTSQDYSERYNKVFKQFVDDILSNDIKTDFHIKSDPRDNELEIGTILHNGAVVIACTKKTNRVVGDTLASWITICMKDANDRDPYAVWAVVAGEKDFSASTGDYSNNIIDAVDDYTRRGGK
jgi:hypothetical protein